MRNPSSQILFNMFNKKRNIQTYFMIYTGVCLMFLEFFLKTQNQLDLGYQVWVIPLKSSEIQTAIATINYKMLTYIIKTHKTSSFSNSILHN